MHIKKKVNIQRLDIARAYMYFQSRPKAESNLTGDGKQSGTAFKKQSVLEVS